MLPAHDETELLKAAGRARSMAERGFGNGDIYIEGFWKSQDILNFRFWEIEMVRFVTFSSETARSSADIKK